MRPIDAEEAFEMADEFPAFEEGLADKTDLKDLLNICDTIEAKPIVHAHWEDTLCLISPYTEDDYEEERYKCNNCTMITDFEYPYCPYCGAQMDEVVE